MKIAQPPYTVPYRIYVDCPHCGWIRDTEGDKITDTVYCDGCRKDYGFEQEPSSRRAE